MKTLIVVDVQNDFCPGGALPVREGNIIVPDINKIMDKFDLVIATQDWHPADHMSFAINYGKNPGEVVKLDGLDQILWPTHCVQGTHGAEFVSTLNKDRFDKIFQKGTDRMIDSYSGFFDNGHKKATGLSDYLKQKRATDVYVAGLATDYCVKFTALDAAKLGFKTYLIEDACRGVDLTAGDIERAIHHLKSVGVIIVKLNNIHLRKKV